MNRYIAFLRGINISGKNKISMAELKKGFESLSLEHVKTYLNSGNVSFSSNQTPIEELTYSIEHMIQTQFNLDIPVLIISQDDLLDVLQHAPDWWGGDDKEIYHNLIFVMAPKNPSDVCEALGEPNRDLEKTESYQNVIFWSFHRKEYQKTNWWSQTATAPAPIRSKLTIRTANTVKKIASMD